MTNENSGEYVRIGKVVEDGAEALRVEAKAIMIKLMSEIEKNKQMIAVGKTFYYYPIKVTSVKALTKEVMEASYQNPKITISLEKVILWKTFWKKTPRIRVKLAPTQSTK